ncbi:MAG TPA: DUF3307 domain-containing protein [Verrucomicrobium sp.]|nr:DUF3307 domain-containing protein [Verrucomicrobium sp.]
MLDLVQSPASPGEGLSLLFALLIGHAIADYPLQGEYLALHKNRHYRGAGMSAQPQGLWLHCLLAHCLIHAGFVWLITGRVIFGVAELVLHFVLDAAKCERKINFHSDQILHGVCKMLYVAVLYVGWVK